jgi:light-regulated signal transduction histidine kinase (bacteriophytochrome)
MGVPSYISSMDDERQRLIAEVERLNRELEALGYSVSHDLRTPARHIEGFVRLLERELPAPGEKGAHYLRTIAAASQRMGAMLDGMSLLARAASAPLELRPVPLAGIVDEVAAELRVPVVKGALPAVQADRALLRTLLQVLLANAAKFTRHRADPRIEAGVQTHAQDAVFCVRDNGVGFDMRYADRLFGLFQRLHRDEELEGAGVGLATARRIVHRHGGRIWAEAAPGRGAAFFFTVIPA